MSDWHDPFAKTEEDLERERRRAEREARRREQQGSIGEKVQQAKGQTPAVPRLKGSDPGAGHRGRAAPGRARA